MDPINDKTDTWFAIRYWMDSRVAANDHIAPFQIHEARSSPPQGEPPIAVYNQGNNENYIGRLNTSTVVNEDISTLYDQWVDLVGFVGFLAIAALLI